MSHFSDLSFYNHQFHPFIHLCLRVAEVYPSMHRVNERGGNLFYRLKHIHQIATEKQ